MGNKPYPIDGGHLQQDQSTVTFAIGAGQKILAQFHSAHVETPEARILIEAGMDPDSRSPKQIIDAPNERAVRSRLGDDPWGVIRRSETVEPHPWRVRYGVIP